MSLKQEERDILNVSSQLLSVLAVLYLVLAGALLAFPSVRESFLVQIDLFHAAAIGVGAFLLGHLSFAPSEFEAVFATLKKEDQSEELSISILRKSARSTGAALSLSLFTSVFLYGLVMQISLYICFVFILWHPVQVFVKTQKLILMNLTKSLILLAIAYYMSPLLAAIGSAVSIVSYSSRVISYIDNNYPIQKG